MQPILLNWPASSVYGWGILGLNLFWRWAADKSVRPLMGAPIGEADLAGIDPLRVFTAREAIVASNWVDNGPGWVAVLLRSRAEVLAVRPDYAVLSGLRVGVVGPWDSAKDGPDAQFEVRAFTAGGYEDPVTGSLNASLAQWLIGTGVAPATYVASQGTVLGRTGRVYVERDGLETWIGGAVTTCITGTLTL